jgi:hypothetical protein
MAVRARKQGCNRSHTKRHHQAKVARTTKFAWVPNPSALSAPHHPGGWPDRLTDRPLATPKWRRLSLHQLRVMSAIEHCRTAALGGHVEACEDCGHRRIAYNNCRNRHCPKCQGAAARAWLAEREADLLPVGYFHVVFSMPAEVGDIALQNKTAVYDLLFHAASETMLTIAADRRHLGARIGITAVLHTWGSALTHHPHVHMIVPGGGIAPDGERWVASRPAFLLPVRVLGKLFRRLFLTNLLALHDAGRLAFFGGLAPLADRRAFLRHLAPVRQKRWVVYAKPPFASPQAVLAYRRPKLFTEAEQRVPDVLSRPHCSSRATRRNLG